MTQALTTTYDLGAEQAGADVRTWLQALSERGLIQQG
ncbi:PqqD family peptide modification chaperone [Deinococcus taklimakanensis]|uniref:PqqD family peptide modification chaperone n=1 Tax=Deinococcus taklimakanensis TaxID=536443 RepID=A0ABW5P1Z5_9DEIO